MSARWISTSTWSPWSGWQAMPIEPPISSVSPSTTNGSRSAVWRTSATACGVVGAEHVGQQHAELVAAEAGDGVGGAQRGLEPLGDLLEEHVAVVVAERVVDLLEVVEVHDHHGQRRRGGARRRAAACWMRSRNSTRFGRPVSASCSDWCSLAIAWRPPRWIASSGRNSSGSTASEKSAAITSTGERPSSRPAVEAWRKRSEAR